MHFSGILKTFVKKILTCYLHSHISKLVSLLILQPFKVSGYMRKLNYMLDDGPDQYGLFAVCQPSRPTYSMLEVRMKSMLFCSKNKMDFTFLDMDARRVIKYSNLSSGGNLKRP